MWSQSAVQNSNEESQAGITGNVPAKRGHKQTAGHPFTRIIFGREAQDKLNEVNINHSSFSGYAPTR